MKRVLVTGGRGALGYHLVKALVKQGINVGICDYVDEYPFPNDLDSDHPLIEQFDSIYFAFDFAFTRFKPDTVFHLAEETKSDWELIDHAINDNIAATARVLRMCSAKGIRCVVPVWMEMSLDNTIAARTPWHYSVAYRRMLPKLFNRGNAVNNIVLLPRIIMPETNEHSWGSLVKRVYNSVISHNEIPIVVNAGEVKERLSHPLCWCRVDDAVDVILNSAKQRTRTDDSYIFERVLPMMSPMDIVNHLCDKYDVHEDPVFLSTESSGEIKDNVPAYTHSPVRKEHLHFIDEVTDVWERWE